MIFVHLKKCLKHIVLKFHRNLARNDTFQALVSMFNRQTMYLFAGVSSLLPKQMPGVGRGYLGQTCGVVDVNGGEFHEFNVYSTVFTSCCFLHRRYRIAPIFFWFFRPLILEVPNTQGPK